MVCAKAIVVLMVSMASDPTKNRGAALSRRIHARLDASTRVDLRWRRFYRGVRAGGHARIRDLSRACHGWIGRPVDVGGVAHARRRADRRCGRKRCGAHRPCSGVAPLNGVGR